MKPSSFEIMHSQCTADLLVIRDVGPWDRFATITNNANNVVHTLYVQGFLKEGMRLQYIDSEGNRDEILHDDRGFKGFVTTRGSRTVMTLEPGQRVYCDLCGKDFTDLPDSGGIYGFGTKAIGPCCSARITVEAEKCGEAHYIKAHCPEGMSFADWVRNVIRRKPC